MFFIINISGVRFGVLYDFFELEESLFFSWIRDRFGWRFGCIGRGRIVFCEGDLRRIDLCF